MKQSSDYIFLYKNIESGGAIFTDLLPVKVYALPVIEPTRCIILPVLNAVISIASDTVSNGRRPLRRRLYGPRMRTACWQLRRSPD